MKNVLVPVVAVLVALIAVPSFADDGRVPQGTLRALGLGGMQVRGMSSSASATGVGAFNVFLFDPFSGAFFFHAGAGFARVTDENAGVNATSSANAGSFPLIDFGGTTHTIVTGANTWTATIGAITINGGGFATSP